eukprot:TRINITY_DN3968_c0_g1_i10.p1 TRINITY_DN3968_c0_g1~~TRINITY_DN3968_c0_g1_i10.p1  ORF type:complete len:437 (-),score=60.02 TRINITY_DN3968_c0_g1_i10:140-1450(-)
MITLRKLIDLSVGQPGLRNILLTTYDNYTTPINLLLAYLQKYFEEPPLNLSSSERKVFMEQKVRANRFRIVGVLKAWLVRRIEDFARNDILYRSFHKLINFLDNDDKNSLTKVPHFQRLPQLKEKFATELKKHIIKEPSTVGTRHRRTLNINQIRPKIPIPAFKDLEGSEYAKDMSQYFLARSAEEIATVLWRINAKLLAKVGNYEWLKNRWTLKDKDKEAPHIVALIARTNLFLSWLPLALTMQRDMPRRIRFIRKLFEVATVCKQQKDFESAWEIYTFITRLNQDNLRTFWSQLPLQIKTGLEQFAKFFDDSNNFKALDEHLQTCEPPCIPVFNFCLKRIMDIQNFHCGTKEFGQSSLKYINLVIQTRLSTFIDRVSSFVPVNTKNVPALKQENLDLYKYLKKGIAVELANIGMDVEHFTNSTQITTSLLSCLE